ncbi:outer membrane protein assembly factor BamB family protein [Brachybacterium hainanense]|uniref:PQQ-binding-like beta-propeller repeat protein n=1 Tax=Brachybacterium hainanense TaxID=1541174 RepID=A0ABV6RCE0_9MICO
MRTKETHVTSVDVRHEGIEAAPAVDASAGIGELPLLSRAGSSSMLQMPLLEQRGRSRFSRRALLAGLAATAGSAALGLSTTSARAHVLADPPPPEEDGTGAGGTAAGTVFASFLTDVHIDQAAAPQDVHLQLVLADMQALGVPLILHGGDITEFGSPDIYDRYLRLVPKDFPAPIQHVAGNHEVRWDASGGAAYRARLHEEGSRSFDHQRVHVIMLEVARPLQEEAHVDAAALDWLRRDLRATGRTPSILVMHCPPGADFHYVNGMDELFSLIADFPVKAVLAGHNHAETVTRVNGTLVLTGRAVKGSPVHYLLRHDPTQKHDRLSIDAIALPAPGDDGERTVTRIATIDLDDRPAREHGALPRDAEARVIGDTLRIRARVGEDAILARALAQVRDTSQYGRTEEGTWVDVTREGADLAADVPLARLGPLLPGPHRLRLRTTDADGGLWEAETGFTTRGGPVRALETFEVEGAVCGALAVTREGTVLVPTDRGEVVSLILRGSRLLRQWSVQTGPVLRGIAMSPDGGTALVPGADGALVAIDVRQGRERWRTKLDGHVTSTPHPIEVDGELGVLVSAGPQLHRLGPDGEVLWSVPIPMQSCGRPAVLGDTVVIGAGDGTVRGYSLAIGAERWTASLSDRGSAYQDLLYGPWTSTIRIIGEDAVLAGTVGTLTALSASKGEKLWSASAAAMYTPPLVLDEGTILVVQERGQAALIDPATGGLTPIGEPGEVSLDAGIVPVLGTRRAWHVSYTGVVSLIDADEASVTPLRQVTTSRVIATPAYLPDAAVLVVADQDGQVHLLDVSHA